MIKATLSLVILSTVYLPGCSGKADKEYPLLPYPPVVVWENKAYVVTEDTIQEDQISEQIGVVKRYIDPSKGVPELDGDSTIALVGSKLYEIKGLSTTSVFAVFFGEEYRKAFR
jgi:hypothetical protein